MNDALPCTRCGTPLPTNSPEGLCPACLMSGGFGSEAATVGMDDTPKGAPRPFMVPDPSELAGYFPQFEILELLGRGGMGAVYKARQKNLNRLVALKILTIDPGEDGAFAERFQREAQALARLNHPNIVNVYDFGETNGLFYFLMEYVGGANLRTLIRGGEMKPEAALALIPAICDALQFAHDEGIVHRDIKPENVLVDKKGRVKIADFGLAKLLGHEGDDHHLTRTGMTLGTPRYMAPEQMDQPETVDHRADIYSLGVVFYEMLTGEVPMGRFALPSERVRIDVKFDEIVLRSLEHDVERRYQHASEVKTDVENVANKPSPAPAVVPHASPVEADPARVPDPKPGIVRPLSRFFWLQTFGFLLLGWVVVGALWNFRTPGCLLGALVLGVIVIETAFRHAKHRPGWEQSWRSTPAWSRVYFGSSLILLAVLLFLVLVSAMNVKWERSPLRWNISALSREAFEAKHEGEEYKLIRGLEAFKEQVPTTELTPVDWNWRSGWHLWGDSGPHHHVFSGFSVMASLFFVTFVLLVLIQQALGAEKFSAWRVATGGWRPALALTGTVLASAALAYGVLNLSFIFSVAGGGASHVGRSATVPASAKQVDLALRKWAMENGCARGDDLLWSVDTVPKGESVAEVALFTAWKPSPFDRWQMTWAGPRRITPHVAAQVVGTENPLQSVVTYTASGSQFDTKDKVRMERVMKGMADAISDSSTMDATTPMDEKISRNAGVPPAAAGISPWILLLGVAGLAVLWSVLRHGRSGQRQPAESL